MPERIVISALHESHLGELGQQLRHPAVYEHIAEAVPSQAEFEEALQRALAGPKDDSPNQEWLNFLVRHARTGEMLGRLEATIHHGFAEVAFLFAPKHWGQGYATEGLVWLHAELTRRHEIETFYATTLPQNHRCQALLRRVGYQQTTAWNAELLSYDDGDLVFWHEKEI